jgi:protein-S-isoprenylcysteine O-methyltransferase Ste14
MGRAGAAAGSFVFLLLAPGMVAGVVPWLLTGWDARDGLWAPVVVIGWALVVGGVAVLLHAFVRFVLEGVGTPAPVAPTERLVVGGAYRYVRNPMYLAVTAIILGQALALGRLVVFAYAAVMVAAFVAFVHWYEEPTLRQRYGEEYDRYRRAVPAWVPRLRPWTSDRSA